MWVVHSAPIYVVVGDEPTWKLKTFPGLVAHHRARVQALLSAPIDPRQGVDTWETATTLLERWREQRACPDPSRGGDRRYR